jgi:hypothetical protein
MDGILAVTSHDATLTVGPEAIGRLSKTRWRGAGEHETRPVRPAEKPQRRCKKTRGAAAKTLQSRYRARKK